MEIILDRSPRLHRKGEHMHKESLKCYMCHADLGVEVIGFRTLCDKCLACQHCCMNCRHHDRTKPNECRIPDTDFISDRSANNFCDEFKMKEEGRSPPSSLSREAAIERAKKLLGG